MVMEEKCHPMVKQQMKFIKTKEWWKHFSWTQLFVYCNTKILFVYMCLFNSKIIAIRESHLYFVVEIMLRNYMILKERERCNIPYWFQDFRLAPQTNTSLFNVLCPYSHAFRETSQKVTHPKTTLSQARFNVVLMVWATKKNMHLVDISSIKQFL